MKEEVRKSYKAILRVLRNDLLKFLSATQHADHLRYSVLKFLTAAGEGYGLDIEQIQDDETMELFGTIWTHMYGPLRTKAHEFVKALQSGVHHNCQCSDCNTLDAVARVGRLYDVVGAKTIAGAFKLWLHYKGTFDEMLAGDIRCLEALAYHPAHGHVFCDEEFLCDLIHGAKEQYEKGKVLVMDIENLHRISRLMARMGNCSEHTIMRLTLNMRGNGVEGCIAGMLGEIIRRADEGDCEVDENELRSTGFWIFLTDLANVARSKDNQCSPETMEEFTQELHIQLEMKYISFKRRLQRLISEGSVYAKHAWVLWQDLADAAGCTEAGLRAEWLAEARCWNATCKSRSYEEEGRMTRNKRCRRCRKVWFCSVECQKEEWPYHKEECEAGEPRLSGHVAAYE